MPTPGKTVYANQYIWLDVARVFYKDRALRAEAGFSGELTLEQHTELLRNLLPALRPSLTNDERLEDDLACVLRGAASLFLKDPSRWDGHVSSYSAGADDVPTLWLSNALCNEARSEVPDGPDSAAWRQSRDVLEKTKVLLCRLAGVGISWQTALEYAPRPLLEVLGLPSLP